MNYLWDSFHKNLGERDEWHLAPRYSCRHRWRRISTQFRKDPNAQECQPQNQWESRRDIAVGRTSLAKHLLAQISFHLLNLFWSPFPKCPFLFWSLEDLVLLQKAFTFLDCSDAWMCQGRTQSPTATHPPIGFSHHGHSTDVWTNVFYFWRPNEGELSGENRRPSEPLLAIMGSNNKPHWSNSNKHYAPGTPLITLQLTAHHSLTTMLWGRRCLFPFYR